MLKDERLLWLDMSQAAERYGVPRNVIPGRSRKALPQADIAIAAE
jgi:hypothetical protein